MRKLLLSVAMSAIAITVYGPVSATAPYGNGVEPIQTATPSPTTSPAPTPSPSPTPTSTGTATNAACDAAAQANLNVGGLAVADVCKTVVDDFGKRPELPNPPERYTLTVENKAFVDQLNASIHQVAKKRYKAVTVEFAPNFIKTEKALRTAVEPNYSESTLGVWLDRIDDHDGVHQLQSAEAASSPVALAFEWIGKPVINWLIKTFFKKNPYSDAKKVDAYVVSFATGANKGSIKSICFVLRGATVNDTICPR